MRILLVNWAKIWDGATNGGGVNGYVQSLALELFERGHDVCYLSGGTTFAPGDRADDRDVDGLSRITPGPVEFRRHEDWLGLRVFEVVNSPVIAPAGYQFKEPQAEASSPELEAAFGRFVERLGPDVVHFHNIEGFSAGCIGAARAAGPGKKVPRVVYSLHNYHTVCPQVYLMRQHLTPCQDYDAGRACVGCIDAVDTRAEREKRVAEFAPAFVSECAARAAALAHKDRVREVNPPANLVPERASFVEGVRRLWRFASREVVTETGAAGSPGVPALASELQLQTQTQILTQLQPRPSAPRPPGRALGDAEDFRIELPVLGSDDRGQTRHLEAERLAVRTPKVDDPGWVALDNTIRAQTEDRAGETAYAARRRAMIAALNSCDRVLAVSRFVRDKFVSLGVDARLIEVNHIGTRINRVVERLADLSFDPPPFDATRPRPVRMVFMGYNNVYKGLAMLADALDLMSAEYLSRIDLSVFAQAGESIEWRFRRMEPRLGRLTVIHGYQFFDIPWILGGKDLGLVTSIWWDNAPQTVFEFHSCGVPVLGADVGGIPDFVKDGHNGLLFRANDRYDLARRLAEVVRDPSKLAGLRANVRPPKEMSEHAAELEKLYEPCLPSAALGARREPPVVENE